MLSDEEIISEFETNLSDFFVVADLQRQEIYNSFAYLAGYQVRDEAHDKRKHKRKGNISILPAIVRAVAGSEIMKDRHIDLVPIDEQYDADADIMGDGVDYAAHVSSWKVNRGIKGRDAAACGIGATVTYLDMSQRDAASGVPVNKRIYPGFTFFDTSGRGGDLNTQANWMGYADPMTCEELEKYVAEKKGKEPNIVPGAGKRYYTDQFMRGMKDQKMRIDMLYHYFWRDYIDVNDVENPLAARDEEQAPNPLRDLIANDAIAVELMAKFTDKVSVDIKAPYWTLDAEEMKELQETIKAIQEMNPDADISLESSKRKVRCYYRAEIGLGMLLSKSKSYCQEVYPLTFITGYFDEVLGIYYGFVRPLSMVQDALNDVMDDLLEYSGKMATGGKIYVKGAKDDIKALVQSKANEDDVTPIPDSGEIIPKDTGGAPQVLLAVAQMLLDLLPRSIGLGQEFMGVITSGTMTDSLYGKVIRQSFAVLEDFSNSSAGDSRRQGILFRDLILSMSRAEEGRLLPVLSPGHDGEDYIRLSKANIARAYVIRVVERPVTEDEKNETLQVLLQLAPQFQAAQINVLPTIIKSLTIDQKSKDELLKIATAPPPAPDPNNAKMLESNIRLLNAQSAKLEQEAMEKQVTIDKAAPEIQSIIERNLAQAYKYNSDAEKTA